MVEIISISILAILLIGMFVFNVVMAREYNSQVKELTKLLKAKNLTEYAVNENINVEETKEHTPPEFIPADNVSESIFDQMIKRQIGEIEDANR